MNNQKLWKKDIYLKSDIKQFKVISFDIYDTIIFRACTKPINLFELLGTHAVKEDFLNKTIDSDVFREIRIKSEAKAREIKHKLCHTHEVTLDEIYDNMPTHIGNVEKLKQAEIEFEKKYSFLNESIVSYIEYIHEQGISIILCSDMYLPRPIIQQLLEFNGFNLSFIKKIYMSNEYGKSKWDGDLYLDILKECNIEPYEMLHIGDNYRSDILNAKNLGIQTLHYNVIPSKEPYDIYEREQLYFQMPLLTELLNIRKLASSLSVSYTEEERFWFSTGANILGPILSLSSQWAVETALENKIRNIYPFMREGKLFSKFIQQFIDKYNLNLNVKPLYASRTSLIIPSIDTMNEEFFEYIFSTKDRTIGELFRMLEIELDIFKELKDMTTEELRENLTLKNEIIEHIKTKEEQVLKNATEKKELFLEYFNEFDIQDGFITIDIGYGGSTAGFLHKVIETGKHLLYFGTHSIPKKIMDGVDLQSFAGIYSFDAIFYARFILDQSIMCDIGSVIGYERNNGKVIPVHSKNAISEKQRKNIKCLQEGALTFNNLYLGLKQEIRDKAMKKHKEIPLLLKRLYNLPTYEEAKHLGTLEHDNNFGSDSKVKIINEVDLVAAQNIGIREFMDSCGYQNDVVWPKGIVTLIEPSYLLVNEFVEKSLIGYEKDIIQILKIVKQDSIDKVIIYGAGEAGMRFVSIFRLLGIDVVCMVDKNKLLQGTEFQDISILSLCDAVHRFRDTPFVIASFYFIHEIMSDIQAVSENRIYYHNFR